MSIYWFLRLLYRNRGINLGQILKKEIGIKKKIHILCPGGSLDLIKKASINKSDLIIFVNHTLKICDLDLLKDCSKIAFSGDPQRAKEIINIKNNKLRKCKSILFPNHLFHLDENIFKNYELIFNILPGFSSNLGIVSNQFKNFRDIIPPAIVFRGYGYGSLSSAIILSLLFEPKELHFWGCDFYSSNTKLYSELAGGNKYSYNYDDFSPYEEKVKNDFNLIKKYSESKNIKFVNHNSINN